jgi:arsenate reductase
MVWEEGFWYFHGWKINRSIMTPSYISHELYLIYDPESELGRKTHALALSLNDVIHEINIMRKSVTPTHWKEILGMLHMAPSELINTGHPDYERTYSGKDYSESDYLEVLFQNPQLVKGPIGILQKKAILCEDPNDILHLDLTPGAEKQAYQF